MFVQVVLATHRVSQSGLVMELPTEAHGVFSVTPWVTVQHESQLSLEQHTGQVVHACSEHDSVTEWLR